MTRSPHYVELADQLAERWSDMPPGSLVESEHRLAEEFGVNRLTAREAVRELERRMIVRRIMGRGTFTAHRLDYEVRLGGVASFHRNVLDRGHEPSTKVLAHDWIGRGRSRRLVVDRVSSVDGFVAATTTEVFPAAIGHRVERAVLEGGSIHEALRADGSDPRRGAVHVAVAMPPVDIAARLQFSASVLPTWHLESDTTNGPGGPVIHQSDSWMRSDMFAVTVLLEPSSD